MTRRNRQKTRSWKTGPFLKLALIALALFCLTPRGQAQTRVCAHRGDKHNAPENTIPALRLAAKKGAPQIEFDVKLSRDGQLVIMHDPTVDRTTNGSGRVADLTFDELRKLDAGSWFGPQFAGTRVPTLREALEAIDPPALCNVHLADVPGLASKVAETIASLGRVRQCFLACTQAQAAEAKAVVPGIRICNMSGQRQLLQPYVKLTVELGAEFIQLVDSPQRGIPEGLAQAVADLHRHHVTVNYFGASDEKKIQALAAAGVDYILTDNLDLAFRALRTSASR